MIELNGIVRIECSNCGFMLGILDVNLEEVAAGVWGDITCPRCRKSFMKDIEKAYDARLVAEKSEESQD